MSLTQQRYHKEEEKKNEKKEERAAFIICRQIECERGVFDGIIYDCV